MKNTLIMVGVVLFVLSCARTPSPQPIQKLKDPDLATINLSCVPQVASLYLDGMTINGKGELFDVKKGSHRIECSLEGYQDFAQAYEIFEDADIQIILELKPTPTPSPLPTSTPIPTPRPTRAPEPTQAKIETNKNQNQEYTPKSRVEILAERMKAGIANGHDWRSMTYEEKKLLCIIAAGTTPEFDLNWGVLILCMDEYYSKELNRRDKLAEALGVCGLANIIINIQQDQ